MEENIEVFKKNIEKDKKYYFEDFKEKIGNDEIAKATKILMNDWNINTYLRNVKNREDNRVAAYKSDCCEICHKPFASFQADGKWYCLMHQNLGELIVLKKKIESQNEKTIDNLFDYIDSILKIIIDIFKQEFFNKETLKNYLNGMNVLI